jgi:hypothetical protein
LPEAARGAAAARYRRFLFPDLAFALSTVMMLYCLTSFGGMRQFFRDSDSGWHIRNGERILSTKQVPVAEPFSFSKPGGQWFAWEWLSDVLMAWAHGRDGLRGVFFLYLGVLSLVSWMWFQLNWAVGVWFLPAAISSWAMLTTSTLHWLARPHLFGWLFLLVALLMAEQSPRRRGRGWIGAMGLLGCVWANMHGSFFLGPSVFALYSAEAALRRRPEAGRLAAWAAAAGMGTFANPYGWNVHSHIFRYLGDRDLLARIGEFQSFNFHVDGASALVLVMLLAGMGVALNLVEGRWARTVICLALFVGALRSARGLPLVALVALPLSLGALCRALERAALAGRWNAWRDWFAAYNRNLRAIDLRCGGWALAPVVCAALFVLARVPALAERSGFDPKAFPVALSERIALLPAEARIYSDDTYGGYLIYRFAGQRKVFFDGRSDYYGTDFMNRYLKISAAKPGWREEWARWGFTHALVAKDQALTLWLPQMGWKKLGEDEAAILFAKGTQ